MHALTKRLRYPLDVAYCASEPLPARYQLTTYRTCSDDRYLLLRSLSSALACSDDRYPCPGVAARCRLDVGSGHRVGVAPA
jgi:hypothetical protein